MATSDQTQEQETSSKDTKESAEKQPTDKKQSTDKKESTDTDKKEFTDKKESVSFMKSVFSGYIDEEILFPYPKPKKEEQEEMESFLKQLEKFCQENIDAAKYDKEERIPQEIIKGLADLGVFSLTAPEEYDGMEVSYTSYCQLQKLMSQHCNSISVTLGAHLSIGTKGLYLYGTKEQKERYYPKLITGEWLAAFSLTEARAGSDAHSIGTTARLSEDGKHYILNGEKIYITNGGIAHFFTLFAKIVSDKEEEKGFTAFIVTKDMPGVTIGKEEKKLGLKASSTTPLHLDNVKVPVENILGEPGKGFKIAMEILNTGRLGLAASCFGGSIRLMKGAIEYAKQRRQFGSSLAQFGLIQKKIARMAALNFAMESAIFMTASLANRKDIDFSLESAICKVFASESVWEIANETVQIYGGNGFIADYPYERAIRDSRISMLFEGTNEILKLFIALSGMRQVGEYLASVGKALDKPLHSPSVLYEYFTSLIVRSFAKQKLDDISPQLSRSAEIIEKYVSLLNKSVERAIKKYKKKVVHQQFILERIANMSMYIYILTCCVSRMDTKIKAGEKNLEHELECLKKFSFLAKEQLKANYWSFKHNCDKMTTKVSNYCCEEEGYPFKLWTWK